MNESLKSLDEFPPLPTVAEILQTTPEGLSEEGIAFFEQLKQNPPNSYKAAEDILIRELEEKFLGNPDNTDDYNILEKVILRLMFSLAKTTKHFLEINILSDPIYKYFDFNVYQFTQRMALKTFQENPPTTLQEAIEIYEATHDKTLKPLAMKAMLEFTEDTEFALWAYMACIACMEKNPEFKKYIGLALEIAIAKASTKAEIAMIEGEVVVKRGVMPKLFYPEYYKALDLKKQQIQTATQVTETLQS